MFIVVLCIIPSAFQWWINPWLSAELWWGWDLNPGKLAPCL